MITAIVIFFFFLIFLTWRMRLIQKSERELWPEEAPQTIDEILNEKVEIEGSFVKVEFGNRIIQISPEEFVVWRTWDRQRKRKFVRDFDKVKK